MRRFLSFLLLTVLALSACSPEFEPIEYGSDGCAHCRMTIVDQRFAAELLTSKGKVFKFDDVTCMKQYMIEQELAPEGLQLFVCDYAGPGQPVLDARTAYYLQGEAFKSPMSGNNAAFRDEESTAGVPGAAEAAKKTWNNL